MVAALVAAAAVAATLALVWRRPSAPVQVPVLSVAAVAAGATEAVAEPHPASVDESAPAFVYSQLQVTSRPQGARVFSRGVGELCAATPCTVTVLRYEPLRLRLQHGQARVQSRVTPKDAVHKVHVVFPELKAAADPVLSDLKVPAMYR